MLRAYLGRGLALLRKGKDTEAEKDFALYLRYADERNIVQKLMQEAKDSRRQNEPFISPRLVP